MEQQARANGRHRVLYEPRRDPVVQQHALELGQHCAQIVLQGVEAVSPNQKDPDGHRALVASEFTRSLLTEVYRMVGAVTGLVVEQRLPSMGRVVGAAAQQPIVRRPRTVQARPRTQKVQRVPARAVVNRRGP
jgi:hypothetical protein